MKYYLQILLILVPAILFSAEWEKVDLPNLNNGHIENAFYYDGQYILQKWDGQYIGSNNLKDWKELDSNYISEYSFQASAVDSVRIYEIEFSNLRRNYDEVHFNKAGVLFFNKKAAFIHFSNYDDLRKKLITNRYDIFSKDITMIKSLDNSFYFYKDSTLYELRNNKLEEIKVTNISKFKDGLIMFRYKGALKILLVSPGKKFESKILVFNLQNDKFSFKETIIDNLQMHYELYTANNYLILNHPPHPKAFNIDSDFKESINLSLPNNKHLYEFYIYGDTLYIYDLRQGKAFYYSMSRKTLIPVDHQFTDDSDLYYDVWDYSFRIVVEDLVVEDESDFDSIKSYFEVYDKENKLVKSTKIGGWYSSSVRVNIIYSDNDFCLINISNDLFRLNNESLEPRKVTNSSGKFGFEGDMLYNITNNRFEDSLRYEISYDYGETWSKYSLYCKLSNADYITDCVQVPNSHKLVFVDDDLYSFTVDSIFHSKVGSDNVELLGDYKTRGKFEKEKYIYFLDENTGKIYQIVDSDNIIELPLDKVTSKKITSIDLNNGYLYATDLYNLYRLKLE
jgi:hypothetical protein